MSRWLCQLSYGPVYFLGTVCPESIRKTRFQMGPTYIPGLSLSTL
jgi:hypothetical protein